MLVVALPILPTGISRADNLLPAGLCVLISGRVICYDRQSAAPIPATPANVPITDFAPSPDGGWLAYRAGLPGASDEMLYLAPIGGAGATVLDKAATPPADLRLNAETLAWAPDGIALAYVTAFGLRVSVPGGMVNMSDEAYIAVRWSPDGSQLAAQIADGSWAFFRIDQPASGGVSLQLLRHFDQSAEIAWLDDHTVIAALQYGGLVRIDPTVNTAPVWTVADEHFIHLQAGTSGQVLAIHIAAGDPNGLAVQIDADGHWTAFGTAKLDPQLTWGPAPGNLLVYITSGTPIMVDRATGSEDMLPINHADRIAWRYGLLPEVQGLALDADLYFIAPDSSGTAQVWRLPRDGFPLIQLTASSTAVSSYQVGSDSIQYATSGGSQATAVGLNGPTATPFLTRTASAPSRLTPTANLTAIAAARPPFLTVTPIATLNPPYQTEAVGWQPGPSVMRRVRGTDRSKAYLISEPILSPTGTFAAALRGDQLLILNWATGQMVAIQGVHQPQQIRWGGS